MNSAIMRLKPHSFLCPFCGEKHRVESDTTGNLTLRCAQMWGDKTSLNVEFSENGVWIKSRYTACENLELNVTIGFYGFHEIEKSQSEKSITIILKSDELEDYNYSKIKSYCDVSCSNKCYLYQHMDPSNGVITVPLKFFYTDTDWEEIISMNQEEEVQDDQSDKEEKKRENHADDDSTDSDENTNTMCEQQEEDNMTQQEPKLKQAGNVPVKKETVLTRLYEYPPKENVELLKKTVEEHKPAVRFLVFATSIYLAYKILNKRDCKFNADNIDEFCKNNLGIELDFLKNKARVDDIISIGKGLLVLYGLKQFDKHFLVDNIKNGSLEDGIQRVEEASKKSSSFDKKFEELFPVAISIIFMYIITRNPDWFEKAKQKLITTGGDLYNKVQVYLEMAKLFIADKFDIDLDDKEECQNAIKFAVMAMILLVIAFVYGKKFIKKVLGEDGEKETSISKFVKQIMKSMEKLMPKAFKKSKKWLEEHSEDEGLPGALVDDDEGDTPF